MPPSEKYDLPAVRSKFLLVCADALLELGFHDIIPFSWPNRESISVSWSPSMPNGGAAFDVENNKWEFFTPISEEENLMVDIADTGQVRIREADDPGGGVCLQLQIDDPDELGELFTFFPSINEEQFSTSVKWVETPLASIVEEIFLVIPKDGRALLLPFDPDRLRLEQPILWNHIVLSCPDDLRSTAELTDLSEGDERLARGPEIDWPRLVANHADWSKLENLLQPCSRDLFYSDDFGVHSWRLHSLPHAGEHYFAPKLALRLRPNQSRMFFHTYLVRSHEGSQLLHELYPLMLNPRRLLKETRLPYPANLSAQMRLSIEFRAFFCEYQYAYAKLCETREPIRDLPILTKRRTQHIGKLHSEYLDEIAAMSAPLPFFLEYPFRQYSRADEELAQIARGQQLFSIVARSLLLLPLEECLALGLWPEITSSICKELQGKPLSDGSWLATYRQLRSMAEKSPERLPLFGALLHAPNAEVDLALDRILKARNAFHHPPNDAHAFILVLKENARTIIDALRSAFRLVRFIVPHSLKFEHGKRLVRAHVLAGFEPEFRVCDFTVQASLESFPTGQLMAMSDGGTHPLVFTQFFRSQPVKLSTMDVGIFDKTVKNAPHFEFVRGFGGKADWAETN